MENKYYKNGKLFDDNGMPLEKGDIVYIKLKGNMFDIIKNIKLPIINYDENNISLNSECLYEYIESLKFNAKLDINTLCSMLHQGAKDNGWWDDKPKNEDEFKKKVLIQLLNCHTELSEATDEIKNKQPMFYIKNGKPEGALVEIVDCIIRCFDLSQWLIDNDIDGSLEEYGIENILQVMLWKYRYNKSRGYKHSNDVEGGKFV